MTGSFWTDWALVAVSLFNTILLAWLGLTVLLNVERRDLGIWIMSGGLLLGAAFFTSHTAILGQDFLAAPQGANLWWQIGWIPVVLSPFAWYVMILWYSGFWSEHDATLRRRHLLWFVQLAVIGVLLLGLMVFAHPLPTFTQVTTLDLSTMLTIGGVPVLFALFPVFAVLCIGLSLDALWRPAASERWMGDLARRRTRPWLMATAALLLIVALLVTGFVIWVVQTARIGLSAPLSLGISQAAIWFDLVISALIALAILALGQGIVSYEVFTGRTLPRRGFFRHWRSAVILAGGYSLVIGWGLAAHLQSIYSLLLTTMLMTVFYALFSWRSFVEREHFMAYLRPFVSSQHVVNQFTGSYSEGQGRAHALFEALCSDVLNVSQAQLIPLGSLAPLAGPPLTIPPDGSAVDVQPMEMLSANQRLVSLEPSASPYRWAVPLWAERGMIGVLLLGEKRDQSLYTQEEIEIAQASGERLIDMLAGEEVARRLMALQRHRLAETQVMDRRTRRALHDDVLPTLHTAILHLSSLSQDAAAQGAIHVLSDAHQQIAKLIRTGTASALNGTQPAAFVSTLTHAIQTEFAEEFEQIVWDTDGETPRFNALSMEVIFYAVREAARNAARHGRGDNQNHPLQLTIRVRFGEQCTITVADNGVGISDPTNDTDGGLALHATMLAILGGELEVSPLLPHGTQVTLRLPNPSMETRDVPSHSARP